MKRILATAAAAAALATPAHASPIGPVCRQVAQGGDNVVVVCVAADLHSSNGTVAPAVYVGCALNDSPTCALLFSSPFVEVGQTGFVRNLAYTLPQVDAGTGSVHVFAGTVGTLYVNGKAYNIATKDYCVGDPSFC